MPIMFWYRETSWGLYFLLSLPQFSIGTSMDNHLIGARGWIRTIDTTRMRRLPYRLATLALSGAANRIRTCVNGVAARHLASRSSPHINHKFLLILFEDKF